MKKNIWIIVLAVLLVGSSLVHAEEMKGGMMGKEMMADKPGMMEGKGDMMGGKGMKGMMGMHGMMGTMMEKSMVATPDGGVIVLTATKLTKYDKDLNVVKEVELKAPTMEDMQKMCPMMGKGMGMGMMGGGPGDKTEVAPKEAASGDASASEDHESHH